MIGEDVDDDLDRRRSFGCRSEEDGDGSSADFCTNPAFSASRFNNVLELLELELDDASLFEEMTLRVNDLDVAAAGVWGEILATTRRRPSRAVGKDIIEDGSCKCKP